MWKLGIGCGSSSKAAKDYQKRVMVTMSVYVVLVFLAAVVVKHGHPHGGMLYFWAVLPAAPIVALMGVIGKYLTDETDEYMRMVTVRSLLVATGLLLSTLVANDFLRSYANVGAIPPFWAFVTFFAAFGLAQGVQMAMNRVSGDE